jgi:transcriptional regulator GlxA family with amidase domain
MANLRGRHTLWSLAAEVGMSARNLARHFVQQMGITPHEFIENARIDAARRLLEGTDHPLQAVAYDCSFGFGGPNADRLWRATGCVAAAVSQELPPIGSASEAAGVQFNAAAT